MDRMDEGIVTTRGKNKFHFIFFLALIMLLVYHNWFKMGVIARTDLFLPSEEWLADYLSLPQVWNEEGGGHVVAIYEAQYYLYFLWAFLHHKVGISIDFGRRLIWFFPFFVGLYSMYFLSMLLFQSRTCSIISSVHFVASNMTVWAAHVSWIQGITGLALVPLVFAFFVEGLLGLRNGSFLRNTVLSGLILSIIVWYDMKIAILACGLVVSFSIFHALWSLYPSRSGVKSTFVLRYLVGLGILVFLPIMLNLYIVLPHILMGSSGAPTASSQPAYLNVAGSGSLFYALLFTYVGIVENGQVFVPFLAAISITSFLAILLCHRCPWVIFFTLFSVVLIFLSKHTAPPFPEFNFYLYKYLPGFVAFRDPTKFLLFQTIPVSILLGVSVSELTRRLRLLLK